MRSILDLFVILPLLVKVAFGAQEVFAGNSCFDATQKVTDTTFSPPANGEISGIRLQYTTGGVTCDTNFATTNFGCGNGWNAPNPFFFIEMIEESTPAITYYPTDATTGVSGLAVHECPDTGGCRLQYWTLAGSAPTDAAISLVNPHYQVTTNQVFSLQFGEGCCQYSTGDNSGRSCADVYFQYESLTERIGDYIKVLSTENWADANAYCADTYGTELATIYDAEHAQQLFDIYAAEPRHYWIGLNDIAAEGAWVYADGYDCDTEDALGCGGYWLPNQPDNANNEDCAAIWNVAQTTSPEDMLNDAPCTYTTIPAFICNALGTSCSDIYHKRSTYFGESLVGTTDVFAMEGGTEQRCVFTYTGENNIFIGAMFESFKLDNVIQCAFGDDDCKNEAIVNYDDYKWGVQRLDDYYGDIADPYLFVTCNANPSMGLIEGTTPDYLLMPFHADFLSTVGFVSQCFYTTAISVYGSQCEDVSLKYWMKADETMGFHTDPTVNDCGDGCSFATSVASEDSFGFYNSYTPNFQCSADGTSTTNYFVGEVIAEAGCVGSEPHSFDWDALMAAGVPAEQDFIEWYDISVDPLALTLDVEVELKYLGASSADDNGAVYGTTYVLDFEDFDAHKDDITLPGTCENRQGDAFTSATFEETWEYSVNPAGFGQIGEPGDYLAYPPAGKWSVSMADSDVCGVVRYSASFSWNDLVQCSNNDKSRGSYVATTDGADSLTLSGTFYINVVSPYAFGSDMGFYRVYQILSHPFIISIAKTVTILSHSGINLFTMSIIAVYKEDEEGIFNLVVLTEAADYLMLSRLDSALSAFTPSGGNLDTADFTALQAAETKDYLGGTKGGCLSNKLNICSQLWRIQASGKCSEDADYIDFSGTYQVQFTPECRTTDITAPTNYCEDWLNEHLLTIAPDGNDQVLLEATLSWKDEICDPELFEVEFSANMAFYSDAGYSVSAEEPFLFEPGETIYVEVSTTYPDGTHSVFDTDLDGVWVCTFGPGVLPSDIDAATASGGCFDGATPLHDDNAFYHIFDNANLVAQDFNFDGHPDGTDETKDQLRFSFSVPGKISRDKLYVQAQIEVSLTTPHEFGDTNVMQRRLLHKMAVANRMNHFIDHIGVGYKNKPEPPQQPQQPHDYYPQPQEPPVAVPSAFVISLSSPWVLALGGLLAVILALNIVFMCYMNCNKRQGTVSFGRRRRSGYASVKNVDSEDFNNSEVNAINVSE